MAPPWHCLPVAWMAPSCRNFGRNSGALRSDRASVLGFCVGSGLPLRSHLPYESAVRRPDNRAPSANPAPCGCDIASLGVTTKPKYVNSADIMADISLTTPSKDRPAGAAAESADAREPYWDLIELLFFAYRDFVSDPDQL